MLRELFMDPMHDLELLGIIASLFSIWRFTMWALHHRSVWRYAVPPITWLLNVTAFFIILIIDHFLPQSFARLEEYWGTLVIVHCIILVTALSIVSDVVGVYETPRNHTGR